MEAGTIPGVPPAQPREDDPDAKGDRAVEAYARGHEGLTEENERDALDYLLAPKPPRMYGVTVQYDTDEGLKPLTFIIRGIDGRKLDSIEQEHVSETTGVIDRIGADAALVAEACTGLENASGRVVKLGSEEFLTIRRPDPHDPERMEEHRLASPADAIVARFATQLGLISGVSREVRRISGYDPERVGTARRRLVDAVGNS